MIQVFPQLASGACVQYAAGRFRSRRTVVSRTKGGYCFRYTDPGAAQVRWSVPLRALSDAEIDAIGQLFEASEGRLGTFIFLDPAANLFSWSEDFRKPAWTADPMVQQSSEVADPFGSQRATRLLNGGQAPQRLSQTLEVPAAFTYCLSAFARSAGGASVSLVRSAGGVEQMETTVLDGKWRRLTSSGVVGGIANGVSFGVELAPGSMLELFGMQVEAQVAPSEYMVTRAAGGVYPAARFDDDEWMITAQSVDRSDAIVKIVSSDEE